MFKISDTVVYGSGQLCVISDIKEVSFGSTKNLYYILKPVYDKNSTVYHPVEGGEAKMRMPLAKEKAKKILAGTDFTLEWNGFDPLRKEYFDGILKEANPEKLVALMRLIYSKRRELAQSGKRLRAADEKAFNEACFSVSEEFAFIFNSDKEAVTDMILGAD